MEMRLEHLGSGARWLSCNVIGLVGLWGGGCLFFFLADPPWGELIDRGQFFVYSMGVFGPSDIHPHKRVEDHKSTFAIPSVNIQHHMDVVVRHFV